MAKSPISMMRSAPATKRTAPQSVGEGPARFGTNCHGADGRRARSPGGGPRMPAAACTSTTNAPKLSRPDLPNAAQWQLRSPIPPSTATTTAAIRPILVRLPVPVPVLAPVPVRVLVRVLVLGYSRRTHTHAHTKP